MSKTDSELAFLAFAYDSRTRGNAATEIVKYFLQLHYHLDVDLRRPDLLGRGNFYGGNRWVPCVGEHPVASGSHRVPWPARGSASTSS